MADIITGDVEAGNQESIGLEASSGNSPRAEETSTAKTGSVRDARRIAKKQSKSGQERKLTLEVEQNISLEILGQTLKECLRNSLRISFIDLRPTRKAIGIVVDNAYRCKQCGFFKTGDLPDGGVCSQCRNPDKAPE